MSQEQNKSIVFFRHGHALNVTSDFLRPLSVLGRHEVKSQCKLYKNSQFDAIFSSPAIRTLQTANILKQELKVTQEEIITIKKLYEIDVKKFKEFISSLSEEHTNIIIVGHNPAISFLHSKALTQGECYKIIFNGKWANIWEHIYVS